MSEPDPKDQRDDVSVPKAVVARLSLYLRELEAAERSGRPTISSSGLGQLLGFTDTQVRKDLGYFGQFGYPGVGYRCSELIEAIRSILGTSQDWRVALVGVGNLGRALLGYRGFGKQGFSVAAAFDVNEEIIGESVEGVEVFALAQLKQIVPQRRIRLGVIAVPAVAAQAVADQLVEAGVVGVLNFAPVRLRLPATVSQVGVDLAIELEQLCYSVLNRTPPQ